MPKLSDLQRIGLLKREDLRGNFFKGKEYPIAPDDYETSNNIGNNVDETTKEYAEKKGEFAVRDESKTIKIDETTGQIKRLVADTTGYGTTQDSVGKNIIYSEKGKSDSKESTLKENERDSLLMKTEDMFMENSIKTMLNRFYNNENIDDTESSLTQSAVDKEFGISKGRNLRRLGEPENSTGYENPYFRVWTQLRPYSKLKNAIRSKNFNDVPYYGERGRLLMEHSPLMKNGKIKIAPEIDDLDKLKRCMFSIENLAWKDHADQLPEAQKGRMGSKGGRIMWFPPYNLKFNEQVTANWNANKFIGRGEDIYTYTNTERNGTLSFTLLIDHPSSINKWAQKYNGTDEEEKNLLRYFAGGLNDKDINNDGLEFIKGVYERNMNHEKTTYHENNDSFTSLIFFPHHYSGLDDYNGTIKQEYDKIIVPASSKKISLKLKSIFQNKIFCFEENVKDKEIEGKENLNFIKKGDIIINNETEYNVNEVKEVFKENDKEGEDNEKIIDYYSVEVKEEIQKINYEGEKKIETEILSLDEEGFKSFNINTNILDDEIDGKTNENQIKVGQFIRSNDTKSNDKKFKIEKIEKDKDNTHDNLVEEIETEIFPFGSSSDKIGFKGVFSDKIKGLDLEKKPFFKIIIPGVDPIEIEYKPDEIEVIDEYAITSRKELQLTYIDYQIDGNLNSGFSDKIIFAEEDLNGIIRIEIDEISYNVISDSGKVFYDISDGIWKPLESGTSVEAPMGFLIHISSPIDISNWEENEKINILADKEIERTQLTSLLYNNGKLPESFKNIKENKECKFNIFNRKETYKITFETPFEKTDFKAEECDIYILSNEENKILLKVIFEKEKEGNPFDYIALGRGFNIPNFKEERVGYEMSEKSGLTEFNKKKKIDKKVKTEIIAWDPKEFLTMDITTNVLDEEIDGKKNENQIKSGQFIRSNHKYSKDKSFKVKEIKENIENPYEKLKEEIETEIYPFKYDSNFISFKGDFFDNIFQLDSEKKPLFKINFPDKKEIKIEYDDKEIKIETGEEELFKKELEITYLDYQNEEIIENLDGTIEKNIKKELIFSDKIIFAEEYLKDFSHIEIEENGKIKDIIIQDYIKVFYDVNERIWKPFTSNVSHGARIGYLVDFDLPLDISKWKKNSKVNILACKEESQTVVTRLIFNNGVPEEFKSIRENKECKFRIFTMDLAYQITFETPFTDADFKQGKDTLVVLDEKDDSPIEIGGWGYRVDTRISGDEPIGIYKQTDSGSFSLNSDKNIIEEDLIKNQIGSINKEQYISFKELYDLNSNFDKETSNTFYKLIKNKDTKKFDIKITSYAPYVGNKNEVKKDAESRVESIIKWIKEKNDKYGEKISSIDKETKLIDISNLFGQKIKGEFIDVKEAKLLNCVKIEFNNFIVFDRNPKKEIITDPVMKKKYEEISEKINKNEQINKEQREIRKLNYNAKTGYKGTEWFYFQHLEKEENILYKKVIEKVKYFNPAFHSISPEGFNERLTFLQQCTRQGPTNSASEVSYSSLGAGNLAFGRPPYCILRIGDFYNTKIVIDSISIDYGDNQWDMNPEGIGLQPMMANISINFKFIGGSGIAEPIERLQNALSFNYYSNTAIYDDRALSNNLVEDKSDNDPNKINDVDAKGAGSGEEEPVLGGQDPGSGEEEPVLEGQDTGSGEEAEKENKPKKDDDFSGMKFPQAFNAAYKQGLKEFTWNNKRYKVERAKTTKETKDLQEDSKLNKNEADIQKNISNTMSGANTVLRDVDEQNNSTLSIARDKREIQKKGADFYKGRNVDFTSYGSLDGVNIPNKLD